MSISYQLYSKPHRPTAAMPVEIYISVAIKLGDNKAITIPAAFLVEHENRQFLKLRPTGHLIVQLVCVAAKHPRTAA